MSSTDVSTPSYVNISPSRPESDQDNLLRALFSITYKNIEYATAVSRQFVVLLDYQKTTFLDTLSQPTAEVSSEASLPAPTSAVSLVLRFVQFLLDRQVDHLAIKSLVVVFQADFLDTSDIHSLVSELPDTKIVQKAILSTYYIALARCSLSPSAEQSALIRAAAQGRISLVAVFGGQGAFNPLCFQDFKDIFLTYAPLLHELIEVLDGVLRELCRLDETADFYHGREIDLRLWLDNPEIVPSGEYLATAPVSFPIIGAISLAQYCVICKVLDKRPGEIRSSLKGVSGHSQGIVTAAGVARANSWVSFYESAKWVTRTLFWLGYYSHQSAPKSRLSASLFRESLDSGNGTPSPMLHISGPTEDEIKSLSARCNRELPPEQRIYLALSNTKDSFVVAGPARSLIGFSRYLRASSAEENADQSRIPYNRRKPIVRSQFLPISAPFHTAHLREAGDKTKKRLENDRLDRDDLGIPVYHTRDGSDLNLAIEDPMDSLINAVTTEHVDWPRTLKCTKATHVLTFGKGIGKSVARNTDGEGVRVIDGSQGSSIADTDTTGSKHELFFPYLSLPTTMTKSWEEMFSPRLVRSKAGSTQISTKFTELTGLPPVMVAGMTPTTVHWDFASAIMNAGYHTELAGGGYHNAESMAAALSQLAGSIPPGRGITCNLIYSSPRTMGWQIALLRQLSQKGYPIEGLTVGAGVPSADIAAEYINSLGLKHITLKPGSEAAIENVIEIAKAHPKFPIILQWTGGRGGGHHSYEDFHLPLLKFYGKIRQSANIVLVVGSGFGNANDSYPYLTGKWACRFGYACMPMDGILLGSRMMVAKEAHTSLEAKRLICQATGTSDTEWTQTYNKPTGGVVTVQSEMGQPIHKIATRGVLFWKEMDDQIFSLPRAEQAEALKERKDYIIHRLNADFAKPWFGRNLAGEVIDLADMTYRDVLHRMISLMYVSQQNRWIHKSYQQLVFDFVVRCRERLPCKLDLTVASLADPSNVMAVFGKSCQGADTTILHPEDVAWFIGRCKARGQKPVNFVPVIDESFSYWLKKDSLWQSEDIEAIPDRDAERVCILHGPVAAQYSQRIDEPAKEILDTVHDSLVSRFEQDERHNVEPMAEPAAQNSVWTPIGSRGVHIHEDKNGRSFRLVPGNDLPTAENFFRIVASATDGWICLVFKNDYICQGKTRRNNFLRLFCNIGLEDTLDIDSVNSTVTVSRNLPDTSKTLVQLMSLDGISVHAKIFHYNPRSAIPIPLHLLFLCDLKSSVNSLHEVMEGRSRRCQSFYSQLWLVSQPPRISGLRSVFSDGPFVLTQTALQEWTNSIAGSHPNDLNLYGDSEIYPLNACILPAWEALVTPLLVPEIDADLLRLVHLSNAFRLAPNARPLAVGDTVEVISRIQSYTIDEKGKNVTVRAEIKRDGATVLTVVSTFLIQGTFTDFSNTFKAKDMQEVIMDSVSMIDDAVLRDREWFVLDDDTKGLIGKTLVFRLHEYCAWRSRTSYKVLQTSGEVFVREWNDQLTHVGEVSFEAANCTGNPVLEFLDRKGRKPRDQVPLEKPGWNGSRSMDVQMPSSSEYYARISKDNNPIHVSGQFAELADLPGPIVHGMYTSAVASTVLEHLVDDLDHLRMRRWSVNFVEKVYHGQKLTVKCDHIAMAQGRMVFQIQALRAEDGEKVLDGEAELDQVPTAYIFTGQGSQSQGMGMDLYNSSEVARKIWDDVDRYLLDTYGELVHTPLLSCSCMLTLNSFRLVHLAHCS